MRKFTNTGAGIWLAVLGPDGSGKTAILDRLENELATSFSSIRRYHLRPHFGRLRRNSAPVSNPHAQAPRGFLLSLLKLLLWFVDYWLSYFLIIRPTVMAGGLVMFDRYGHDLLVDPLRYRVPSCALGCARLLASNLPLPDIFILLHVPAETLQRRKAEVSYFESARQGSDYFRLIKYLPNTVAIDAVRPLDQVACEVRKSIAALGDARQHSCEVQFVAR